MLYNTKRKKFFLKILLILLIALITQIYYMNSEILASNKSVKKLKIVLNDNTYKNKRKTRNVEVKVYNGKTRLKKNKDYTLKYKNNKNVGKASVTITGKGKYTGSVTKTFYIVPNKAKISFDIYFLAKSLNI